MNAPSLSITVLVDNRAGEGLWIEFAGRRILFDAGQGPALVANAPALGIDLRKADALILSHGHYDHAGGLAHVLAQADRAEAYFHPNALIPRYSVRDGKARSIGMPDDSLRAQERLPERRRHGATAPIMIDDRIGITGPIPRETKFEDTGGPFFLDPRGLLPDPIEDDLALWIRTDEGVIVCAGCCHAGLANTLRHVSRLTDNAPLRAVIGGFHLQSASEPRLAETIAALRSLEAERIIPCHCTGEGAVRTLRDALGPRVAPGAAGQRLFF